MRTTLDIADDVLYAAKERARRENRTAGQVISDLARRALTTESLSAPAPIGPPELKSVHGFRPFPKRGGIVTEDLINRLRDEGEY